MTDISVALQGALGVSNETAQNFISAAKEIEAIIGELNKIDKISKDNAESVNEVSLASKHLNEMTEALNYELMKFK